MADDDWDLHAVVRGCNIASSAASSTTAAAATTTTTSTTGSSFMPDSIQVPFFSFQTRSISVGELGDLYMPFLHESNLSVSSSSSLPCLNHQQQQQQEQQQKQLKRPFSVSVSSSTTATSKASNTSRSKRRKIQQKRVCHVPAEALNSDVWAWRKYGQKPIKGSPYPRGYYRCSTSKGCLARKQVERNRSDSGMFIVTYTAEHNHPAPTHRNSLAGSTRQKPSDQQPNTTKSPSTTTTTTTLSTATSAEDTVLPFEDLELEVDEDMLSLSDTVVSDDFFEGLEVFATGDSFSGHSSTTTTTTTSSSFDFPWLTNNAATV